MRAIRFSLLALAACGAPMTPADKAALASFKSTIDACNTQPDAGGCKADAKAAFDAAMNAKFDGGFK